MVVLAQDEARSLGHGYIGTEHLLLGLLREEEGIAARTLTGLGLTLGAAHARIEERAGRGDAPPAGQIPFTPRAKRSLELGLRHAVSLGHNYIGTEHLLLGLASADPARLEEFGIGEAAVREHVLGMLGGGTPAGAMWDYQLDTLAPNEPVDAKLDELRADGWEIVSVRVERRRKHRDA